jgi:hypothetical protein
MKTTSARRTEGFPPRVDAVEKVFLGVTSEIFCALLLLEGVDPTIARNKEAIVAGEDGNEVAKPLHQLSRPAAGKDGSTAVRPKPMQTVVAFGTDHPYDWVGVVALPSPSSTGALHITPLSHLK